MTACGRSAPVGAGRPRGWTGRRAAPGGRRAAAGPYDINFGLDIGYQGPNGALGMDHVAVMEAMGALGRRVTTPDDIKPAIEWAIRASEEQRVPALVEILVERETDAAMGKSIDNVNEYEPIEEGERELASLADNIPERD